MQEIHLLGDAEVRPGCAVNSISFSHIERKGRSVEGM